MMDSASRPKDGFVMSPFGRLHYLEMGSGPPVVLLHGAGSSAYEFEHVFSDLAADFRVIAWDMPGHGDSDPLLRYMTIAEYSDALLAVLRHLELVRPHLVGTSIGAQIAACAAKHSSEVASVSLVELPFRSVEAWIKIWPVVETMFSNPTRTNGFFYDTHHKLRNNWRCWHVNCEDVPRARGHIRDVINTYGKDSNRYRVRVAGLFPISFCKSSAPGALKGSLLMGLLKVPC